MSPPPADRGGGFVAIVSDDDAIVGPSAESCVRAVHHDSRRRRRRDQPRPPPCSGSSRSPATSAIVARRSSRSRRRSPSEGELVVDVTKAGVVSVDETDGEESGMQDNRLHGAGRHRVEEGLGWRDRANRTGEQVSNPVRSCDPVESMEHAPLSLLTSEPKRAHPQMGQNMVRKKPEEGPNWIPNWIPTGRQASTDHPWSAFVRVSSKSPSSSLARLIGRHPEESRRFGIDDLDLGEQRRLVDRRSIHPGRDRMPSQPIDAAGSQQFPQPRR